MLSDNNRHEGERRTRVTKIKIMWIVCFMSHMRLGISLFFFFFECFCHSFLFGKESWQTSEAEELLLDWRSREAEERGCSCWYLRNLWPLLQAEGSLREGERKSEHNFHHLWCMRLSLVWGLTLIFWGLKLEIPFFVLIPAASNNSESLWKQEKSWVKLPGLSSDSSVLIVSTFTWFCSYLVPSLESAQRLEQSLHMVDGSKRPLAPDNCWTLCSSEWFNLPQIHPWGSSHGTKTSV